MQAQPEAAAAAGVEKNEAVIDYDNSLGVYIASETNPASRILSNDFITPLCVEGRWYPSVTHFMEAEKLALAGHPEYRDLFSTRDPDDTSPEAGERVIDALATAMTAARGPPSIKINYRTKRDPRTNAVIRLPRERVVVYKNPIVLSEAVWHANRVQLMRTALNAKFRAPTKIGSTLRDVLLGSGNRAIIYFEQNPDFWGTKQDMITGSRINPRTGLPFPNCVGELMMQIRTELSNEMD